MGIGPVMLDVAGKTLTPEDEQRLKHPLVGGVILFARNYESPAQLAALTASIHALRTPPLLIASITKAVACNVSAKVSHASRPCASWARSGMLIPGRRVIWRRKSAS